MSQDKDKNLDDIKCVACLFIEADTMKFKKEIKACWITSYSFYICNSNLKWVAALISREEQHKYCIEQLENSFLCKNHKDDVYNYKKLFGVGAYIIFNDFEGFFEMLKERCNELSCEYTEEIDIQKLKEMVFEEVKKTPEDWLNTINGKKWGEFCNEK